MIRAFFEHDGGIVSQGKSDNEVARRSLHLNFGSVARFSIPQKAIEQAEFHKL